MDLKPSTIMAYNDQGESLDISAKLDAKGMLNWTAPAGNWKVYAMFVGFHGKMVERAAPGGEGNVIDHFNGLALKHYLNRFDSAFKGNDISGIRSFSMIVMKWMMREVRAIGRPHFLVSFKKEEDTILKNTFRNYLEETVRN